MIRLDLPRVDINERSAHTEMYEYQRRAAGRMHEYQRFEQSPYRPGPSYLVENRIDPMRQPSHVRREARYAVYSCLSRARHDIESIAKHQASRLGVRFGCPDSAMIDAFSHAIVMCLRRSMRDVLSHPIGDNDVNVCVRPEDYKVMVGFSHRFRELFKAHDLGSAAFVERDDLGINGHIDHSLMRTIY